MEWLQRVPGRRLGRVAVRLTRVVNEPEQGIGVVEQDFYYIGRRHHLHCPVQLHLPSVRQAVSQAVPEACSHTHETKKRRNGHASAWGSDGCHEGNKEKEKRKFEPNPNQSRDYN